MTNGYQTVQTAHAIADFAFEFPEIFKEWKEKSNSIICLSAKDLNDLNALTERLDKKGIKYVKFYEPDVNEITAICIEPSDQSRKTTSFLPLCNKKSGEIDKHNVPLVEQQVLTKEICEEKMKSTYQFENQSVWEHGVSVKEHFEKLYEKLKNNSIESGDFIPIHIVENKEKIINVLETIGIDTIKEYCLWHDVGKPFCLTIDSEGKKHFPEHEKVSYDVFKSIGGDEKIALMLLHDMDIHRAKPSQMDEYLQLDYNMQILHMIVGLAELQSNAKMFGGYESTGFKIKYKNFVKVSKKILENNF